MAGSPRAFIHSGQIASPRCPPRPLTLSRCPPHKGGLQKPLLTGVGGHSPLLSVGAWGAQCPSGASSWGPKAVHVRSESI